MSATDPFSWMFSWSPLATPPSDTCSVPLAMMKFASTFHSDPAPSITALAGESLGLPIRTNDVVDTKPPSVTLSEPPVSPPTVIEPLLVQVDPASVTVIAPPRICAMEPAPGDVSEPPFVISSVP